MYSLSNIPVWHLARAHGIHVSRDTPWSARFRARRRRRLMIERWIEGRGERTRRVFSRTYRWWRWRSCWTRPRRIGTARKSCLRRSRRSGATWINNRTSLPLLSRARLIARCAMSAAGLSERYYHFTTLRHFSQTMLSQRTRWARDGLLAKPAGSNSIYLSFLFSLSALQRYLTASSARHLTKRVLLPLVFVRSLSVLTKFFIQFGRWQHGRWRVLRRARFKRGESSPDTYIHTTRL